MINNHYQLYVDNVLGLAQTIVIKFEVCAEAVNQAVASLAGHDAVDYENKRSWKYYQNISGQYHFTDKMIQVNSLDLNERIDFTPQNLYEHKATRQAYEYGSRYYLDLLQQYPDQETLILGILYPCDLTQAIAARDGTILHYPAKYVESTEYSLMAQLQAWVYAYLDRWVNKQFLISDDLYAATFVGQLYLHLVQAIFNLRLAACKTNEVHSFHVRQYLASHGMLDKYLAALTRDQALFFYRNILYIQRNAGKRDTFDWLVDKVMTRRNLPLYAYAMNHDISDMRRTSLNEEHPMLPEIMFKRKPLNAPAQETDKDAYSLAQVFTKTRELTKGNPAYQDDYGQSIKEVLTDSVSSIKVTKMLECSVIDYADAVPYPMAEILFNHWLYLSAKGKYIATVLLSLPKTGDALRLESQDAAALFLYALSKAAEPSTQTSGTLGLLRIPRITTHRVVRTAVPSIAALKKLTDAKHMPPEVLAELYETRVALPQLVSIEAFHAKCQEIYDASALQYAIYASQENQITRGQAQLATTAFYSDESVQFTQLRDPLAPALGMRYSAWLEKNNFSFVDYTPEDFYTLALAIVVEATGVDNAVALSLAAIQKAMANLFTQLSSYSIQLVTEINDSSIVIVPHPELRVGDTRRQGYFHDYVIGTSVTVQDTHMVETQNHVFDLDKVYPVSAPTFSTGWHAYHELTVKGRVSTEDVAHVLARIDSGLLGSSSFNFDSESKALSIAQRQQLTDTYCHCPHDEAV